jgi:hypothetical protein
LVQKQHEHTATAHVGRRHGNSPEATIPSHDNMLEAVAFGFMHVAGSRPNLRLNGIVVDAYQLESTLREIFAFATTNFGTESRDARN